MKLLAFMLCCLALSAIVAARASPQGITLYVSPRGHDEWSGRLNKTLAQWQGMGPDAHSRVADPEFAAPQAGNFTLRPGSPALVLGFHPINLTGVGAGG